MPIISFSYVRERLVEAEVYDEAEQATNQRPTRGIRLTPEDDGLRVEFISRDPAAAKFAATDAKLKLGIVSVRALRDVIVRILDERHDIALVDLRELEDE